MTLFEFMSLSKAEKLRRLPWISDWNLAMCQETIEMDFRPGYSHEEAELRSRVLGLEAKHNSNRRGESHQMKCS